MKINKAIKKIKKTKNRISSGKALMAFQSRADLFYWLVGSHHSLEEKLKTLKAILEADDWTVDK